MFKYRKAYAENEDKYPQDVKALIDIMRSHSKKKPKKKISGDKDGNNKNKEKSERESSFAQKNQGYACWCCGDKQCKFRDCPKKAILAKDQWHDPSKYSNSYCQQVNNQKVEDERDYEVSFSHAQCHAKVLDGKEIQDKILDSWSTVSLMKDPEKVEDIKQRKVNVLMSTNAGSKIIDKEATRKGCGKVLYDPDAITNLRSLSEMVKRGYCVQMDTNLDNSFLTTSRDGEEIKFTCNDKGLYVLAEVNSIEGFTEREVQRARRAKQLYYNLDAPTLDA